jgi:hypothetical protein
MASRMDPHEYLSQTHASLGVMQRQMRSTALGSFDN